MSDSSNPSLDAVRKALTRIVTRGAEVYWILETADVLLDLPTVRERVPSSNATDEELALAVIDAINEKVARLRAPQRQILIVCLALEPEFQGLSAEKRQRIAGERFRGGRNPVTWGTMRRIHMPRAIARLAVLLHAGE